MLLMNLREQVREFHHVFEHPSAAKPAIPTDERVRFRLSLIAEEFCELLEATFGARDVEFFRKTLADLITGTTSLAGEVRVHLPQFVDALGDIDYVVEGTRQEFGVDGGPIADEIHRANMAKVFPDGRPHKRADGKTLKPAGWTPPDIEGVLRAQGWKGA